MKTITLTNDFEVKTNDNLVIPQFKATTSCYAGITTIEEILKTEEK